MKLPNEMARMSPTNARKPNQQSATEAALVTATGKKLIIILLTMMTLNRNKSVYRTW
jgi:hypothetical protein